MEAMTPLGKLIQGRRHELGMTLQDISDKTGLSVQTINAIERGGSKRPRFETLYPIARALDLAIEDLASAVYEPVPA